MDGERNLDALLKTMQPHLMDGKWVFRTSESSFDAATLETAILMFREPEGITIISPATPADYDLPIWSMISLRLRQHLPR
jgi:hypothetical protein